MFVIDLLKQSIAMELALTLKTSKYIAPSTCSNIIISDYIALNLIRRKLQRYENMSIVLQCKDSAMIAFMLI
jgi:hypothetical protein